MNYRHILVCSLLCLCSEVLNADIVFHADLSPTSPTRDVNPAVSGPVGSTGTIYLWTELDTTDRINAVALDFVSDTPGIVKATAHRIDNPNAAVVGLRWPNTSAINPGTVASGGFDEMFHDSRVVSFDSGIRGSLNSSAFDPTYDSTGDSFRYSAVDYEITNVGCAELYLEVDERGITTASGGIVPIRFGWGDTAINNNDFGVRTALPEVTVCGVPEPSSSLLIGLLLTLVGGRRWLGLRMRTTL